MCARRSRISLRKESSVFTFLTHALPIKPADLVILAIGIAVPALVSAELAGAGQHGNPLRQEQRCQIVGCGAPRFWGGPRSLSAAVPAVNPPVVVVLPSEPGAARAAPHLALAMTDRPSGEQAV